MPQEQQDELNQDRNAAEAHAAKINANVRHYFTKCEDGSVVVNYEYVGPRRDTLIGEAELREFSRLTALGACTAKNCTCPGNASCGLNRPNDRPNPWVQIEIETAPIPEPEIVTPEPEVENPEPEIENALGPIVTAAGMSDGEDNDVFAIGQVVSNVPVPMMRNPPRNYDYWDSLDVDSE